MAERFNKKEVYSQFCVQLQQEALLIIHWRGKTKTEAEITCYHAGQKECQYKALASLSLKLYIVGSLAVVIQST